MASAAVPRRSIRVRDESDWVLRLCKWGSVGLFVVIAAFDCQAQPPKQPAIGDIFESGSKGYPADGDVFESGGKGTPGDVDESGTAVTRGTSDAAWRCTRFPPIRGPKGAKTSTPEELITAVYEFYRAQGFSKWGAAYMLGSLMWESNGLDPTARQPGGPGYGLAQWTDDSEHNSYPALICYAGIHGLCKDNFVVQAHSSHEGAL
jgi:hypothetical protein